MRVHSREFRIEVVRRILGGEKVPTLAQELGIHRKLLYEWLHRFNHGGESNLRERGRPKKSDVLMPPATEGTPPRVAELERTIANQEIVIEFLKQALQTTRPMSPNGKQAWRSGIFQAIEIMMTRQTGLTVEAMC